MKKTTLLIGSALALASCGGGEPVATSTPGPLAVSVTYPSDPEAAEVRSRYLKLRGKATPGSTVSETLTDASVDVGAAGTWSLEVPVDVGYSELDVYAELDDRSSAPAPVMVQRKRSASEARTYAARQEAKKRAKAAREAAKRAADPAYGLSTDELYEACLEGRITDYRTCFKAGVKFGSSATEEALSEMEREGE